MKKEKRGRSKEGPAHRVIKLAQPAPITDLPGPGQWLITEYQSTALFGLKTSLATSSVGKTLLVPTPYSIKMAFVDAAFRSGLGDKECEDLLESLIDVDLRVAPPHVACVTHTFLKVRQRARAPNWDKKKQSEIEFQNALVKKLSELYPGFSASVWDNLSIEELRRSIAFAYDSSIAYSEFIHFDGTWRWAFQIAAGQDALTDRLVRIAPHVSYIGRRGSFVQFLAVFRAHELGPDFTQPLQGGRAWTLPQRAHVAVLDDFGPEATLEVLSSFTSKSPKRDRHRRFVETIVPLGLVNTGPGFSEYRVSRIERIT